jgi:hypothetical protein
MNKLNDFEVVNDLLDQIVGGGSSTVVHFSGENAVASYRFLSLYMLLWLEWIWYWYHLFKQCNRKCRTLNGRTLNGRKKKEDFFDYKISISSFYFKLINKSRV